MDFFENSLLKLLRKMHVRILISFGAGDLGTEVDFLYAMMWVTKVTAWCDMFVAQTR